MNGESLRVLMVEDDDDFVRVVGRILAAEKAWPIDISNAWSIKEAIQKMREDDFTAILLDLNLPDSAGLDTFMQIRLHAPHIPIVVLSANKDFWTAIQSVREGAQDYLLKNEMSGPLLARSLYYSVERNNVIETLRRLSLLDELTGLYNRRGLISLSEQHMSLAMRTQRSLMVVYADVDGLKSINDHYGHSAGDEALMRAAKVLRRTFRRSDIIGRIGGDEFVVLAIDATPDKMNGVIERLNQSQEEENGLHTEPYPVVLSAGVEHIDPSLPLGIEEWISRADLALYEEKRKRRVIN